MQFKPRYLLTQLVLTFITFSFWFTVKAQSNEPYQISGEMVAFGDVANSNPNSFQFSPDGQTVVYVADQEIDEVFELYSVPITGGTPTKLNSNLVADGDVRIKFQISNDSQRVVYMADQEIDGILELYSTPINGGPTARLTSNINSIRNVLDFEISEDSKYVVYRVDESINNPFDLTRIRLYSVAIDGTEFTQLNASLVTGGDVKNGYQLSANSQRVVYLADQDVNDQVELYTVAITGGTVTQLNDTLINGDIGVDEVLLSADSQRAIYLIDQGNHSDLFSVPIRGGSQIGLNSPIVTNGNIFDFTLSADSQHAVYRGDVDIDGKVELYSVPIAGGTTVTLSADLGNNSRVSSYEISPNGQTVVYVYAPLNNNLSRSLNSVSITGGEVKNLTPNIVAGRVIFPGFKISPNNQRVVFRVDQDIEGVYELYSVSVNGGPIIKLNPDLIESRLVVSNFKLSADGLLVFYQADQNIENLFELYSAPITGGLASRLNANLTFMGEVDGFEVSPIESRVVYLADQDIFDDHELFALEVKAEEAEELCVAIKASNGKFAAICL